MLKILETFEFLESVFSDNFTPQINLPTRITGTSSTLINNILTNSQNVYTSGNLTTSISDHHPHFTIIENLLSDTLIKKDVKTLKRDFSKFHSDDFIRDLKSVNWSVATQNNPNPDTAEHFMLIINNLLDKHANFKEQAKRKEKLIFKPWITKHILTSIK